MILDIGLGAYALIIILLIAGKLATAAGRRTGRSRTPVTDRRTARSVRDHAGPPPLFRRSPASAAARNAWTPPVHSPIPYAGFDCPCQDEDTTPTQMIPTIISLGSRDWWLHHPNSGAGSDPQG